MLILLIRKISVVLRLYGGIVPRRRIEQQRQQVVVGVAYRPGPPQAVQGIGGVFIPH